MNNDDFIPVDKQSAKWTTQDKESSVTFTNVTLKQKGKVSVKQMFISTWEESISAGIQYSHGFGSGSIFCEFISLLL